MSARVGVDKHRHRTGSLTRWISKGEDVSELVAKLLQCRKVGHIDGMMAFCLVSTKEKLLRNGHDAGRGVDCGMRAGGERGRER